MKKVYIYLAIAAFLAIGLFVASFLYIDREGHKTFLYAIYYDNILTGYEKTDRYLVENKLIYKSYLELPRDILDRKTIRKIRFDAGGKNFIDYTEETTANASQSTAYVKNDNNYISFLGVGNADFAYLDHMPILGNFTMFENETLATYPPLIRRYNFKRRGEQFFNTLTVISPNLPPLPGVISITAIGKDVIEIEGKKIKCENLVFELNGGDLASVWIAQTFHNVLMVKIPKTGFKAILCAKKDVIPVEEYTRKSNLYSEKEVTFKNGDISLSGILSIPNTEKSPYPAVLLIWDSGPLDNTAMGMFTDITHALAENGYCVFRFDKRGIGKSQGLFSTYDQSEEIGDLRKAVEFLKSTPEVDPTRIATLGYSEGGFYAAYLASLDDGIKNCIIISAADSMNPAKDDFKKIKEFVRRNVTANPQYSKNVVNTILQSGEIIKDKGDWITILGNSIFTKKVKMRDGYDMVDTLKKIKTPVLILHGKKDNINLPEGVRELENALSAGGNSRFTVTYFADLDHLMGNMVKNGNVREHIEVDPSVIKNLVSWLNDNLIPVPLPPASITAADNIPSDGAETQPKNQETAAPLLTPEQVPDVSQ
ncbi:MAG: alpha/beta fold hydrolase [Candidatus Omnitrophica bacterium]|nr:alpha/beta fold hydrolase [Candidatus Omnitrophota bacterium]